MSDDVTVTDESTRPSVTTKRPEVRTSDVSRIDERPAEVVFRIKDLDFYYGSFKALRGVSLDLHRNEITALIGPSGCGKSTLLRCLNRMNDLIPGTRVDGTIEFFGENLYGSGVYDNVAFGPRVNGFPRSQMDDIVEESLRHAALWDEVKDKLKQSALALSGGQQQRVCIARAIAVKPEVILMDEPASALDPIATLRIEELMAQLKLDYTIVVVTHNMQQAARVSDRTAFLTADVDQSGSRCGVLVEYDRTETLFTKPSDPRTDDYVTGRFG
jgi:phosphate transport system ATP-binding protein